MSVNNITLQWVELMHQSMSEDFEKAISSCKTMKVIRSAAETCRGVAHGMLECQASEGAGGCSNTEATTERAATLWHVHVYCA